MAGSSGIGITPYIITVNAGEVCIVLCMNFKIM